MSSLILTISFYFNSSYEKYVKEVNSLVLEWGPIHSERFWRENVRKFEENDFFVIR